MTPKDVIRKFKKETGNDLLFEDGEFLLINPMSFSGLPISSLPDNLRVVGNLSLNDCPITSLPDNLRVEGNLSLNNCPISSLPKKLRVAGSLSLTKTQITSLPKDLIVGEDLHLRYTPIKSLPKGLKVHGSIDASSTQLSSLPEGLKLGGYLNVSNTPITQLPNKMKIKYDIILRNTPITSLPDDLTKIGGDLMLGYSSIKSLPDGLIVNGSLELSNTPIASLPTGLKVGGNLILVNTPLTSLPDKLQVGEYLDLSFTSIQSLPDDLKVQIGIIDIDFEESKKEAINCFVENANSNNEEVNELDYEEEEYDFDSWEDEEDFIIRLNKLEKDTILSFQVCDYHSADKWAIFDSASISLKDNKALLNLEGSIKLEMWNGPENIQHLFKYLSEAVIESGLFIHSEDDDLELDKWCTITLGVLIDKDFMFFETVNSYMKLIGDLESKAQKKWKELYEQEIEIRNIEESNKEAANLTSGSADSNNKEDYEFDCNTEGEYYCDSWKEEKDFIIRLNKLVEDGTVSFNFRECEYHSADRWEIFDSVYITLKDNKALLYLNASIWVGMWNGPENILHLFKNLSEEVVKSGIFIHSEEEDLILDKRCSIKLGVFIDKDFMFFETVNHYMKLIGDLETKAKQKWFEKMTANYKK